MADYHKNVPGDLLENLRYRRMLRKYALKGPEYRRAIMTMCRDDVLFFFKAMCFLFEPRPSVSPSGKERPKVIPFIPWSHQEPVIKMIRDNLGFKDIGCLAGDTIVLTNHGPKRITDIDVSDLVWDGEEYVKHEGVVCQGLREVITVEGVTLTPDHEVLRDDGSWGRADGGWAEPKLPGESADSESALVYDIVNCGPRRRFVVLGNRPLIVHNCEKSRGEGMSWIIVLLAVYYWIFIKMSAVGVVSRNENAVDNPDDPDSMFWKIDHELEWLPKWMIGIKGVDFKRDLTRHVLKNLRNEATLVGYPATADVASGGRKDWFGMDELAKFPRPADAEAMASTQYVTNSRLFVSTPKGADGAYYELMNSDSSMVKVIVDWKDNETRNKGLYRMVDGVPMAVSPHSSLPKDYDPPTDKIHDLFSRLRRRGYKLEGTIRSPWYDIQCDRPGATPQNVAQELDRSYGGSMYMIFGNDFMDAARKSCRQPMSEGEVSQDEAYAECYYDKRPKGQVKLWCKLDMEGNPPPCPYVIGCDISSGQGGSYTSNSVLIIIDMNTKEQVFEYATNIVKPERFAELAVGIAKKFNNAYLAWEHMGPGTAFTRSVVESGYANIFFRKAMSSKNRRPTKMIGWVANTETKEILFAEIERAVRAGEYVLRSEDLVRECAQYARVLGKIDYIHKAGQDDASMGTAHGDRVIALGVALQAAKDRPVERMMEDASDRIIVPGTMAYRFKQWEQGQADTMATQEQMMLSTMAGNLADTPTFGI